MSKLFNLSIGDYKKIELEDLLGLSFPYSIEDVYSSGLQLKKKMLEDTSLNPEDKEKIRVFIETATKQLLPEITNQNLVLSKVIDSDNHMVIEKPPIKHGGGVLNPYTIGAPIDYESNLITRTVNIDTLFRDNYFSTNASDFHISLPTVIKNVVQMKLVACELPQSIYAISSSQGNNFFTISWSGAVDGSANIILSDGNYQPCIDPGIKCERGLQQELNFQLSRAMPHGAGGLIEAIVDNRTGKIILGATTTSGITELILHFNLDIGGVRRSEIPLQLKMGWLMGYRFGQYQGNTAYTTEGLYDFRGPRYLYLVVNDYNNNHAENMIGVFNSSLTQPENILARLSWLQYVHFATTNVPMDYVSNLRDYFGPVDIQKLKIQLLGPYGRVISLNNMDYSLALEFKCLYKV